MVAHSCVRERAAMKFGTAQLLKNLSLLLILLPTATQQITLVLWAFVFCAEGGIFNFFKETDMKKPKHTHCISNFLLGFGSILNIAPVVSVSSTIEIEPNEYKYFNNAWGETGRHLRDALNKRVWGKYGN